MPYRQLALVLALLVGLWATAPTVAQAQPGAPAMHRSDPYRYSAQTGHTIQPPITPAYDAAGGEAILGAPLTEVFTDTDGMRVQYFEGARFELSTAPDGSAQIARTLLGNLLTPGRSEDAFRPHETNTVPTDAAFFPETRHTLRGAFRVFWEGNGGLSVFGYPISEALHETDGGRTEPRLVQWFERARFVYHPDAAPEAQVTLTPLGRIYADRSEVPAALRAPVPPIIKLGQGQFSFNPSSASGRNIRLALQRLDGTMVPPGRLLSFNATLGEVSPRTGYANAGMIVGGNVTDGVGGGICLVSSALYVAALRAGLAIESRRGHSLLLRFAEAAPGMEAAVAQPDLDFVLRNDTPYPMMVSAFYQGNTLVVTLWGQSDGRSATLSAPAMTNVRTVPDEWVFVPSLEPGAVQRVSQGNAGMEVRITREVRAADGSLLDRSTALTRYAPWPAVYHYGPEVVPPGATPSLTPATETPAPTTMAPPSDAAPIITATPLPL